MLYFLANCYTGLEFLKSIYLRDFISFSLSFLLVLLLGKPFIHYLKKKKFGETIRQEGPASHMSKKGTPTMGGVLIIFSLLLTTLLVADIRNSFILLLIFSTFIFAGIGFIDDYKKFTVNKRGLAGRKKLLGQSIVALAVWAYIKFIGLTGDTSVDFSVVSPNNARWMIYLGGIGMLIFILFVILGSSNAVNITDGLDGLAIMPTVICAAILGVIAYFTGHIELSSHLQLYYTSGIGEMTIFLAAICGSGLGFLWYNCYPAQIFMGDTGSLALGGVLGVVAVLLKQELLLPIIGAIFVMEAVSVILQVGSFKTRGKRIFRMAPIHHHFELGGLAETKVTMRFWITTILLGIFALGLIKLRGI